MPKKSTSSSIHLLKKGSISGVAMFTALSATVPAYATIDNTATAFGTFNAADDTQSAPDTENVPVLSNRDLSIVKAVFTVPSTNLGTDTVNTDAGDTIVYRYTITNNGSLTENNVAVTDVGPTFNGNAGTGIFLGGITEIVAPAPGAGTGDAATLAPDETVVFEATYELSTLDVLNAAGITDGVSNVATATSDDIPASPASAPALTQIDPFTGLTISKVAVLNDNIVADGFAEAGETITYTYTVVNTGNVALSDVRVDDIHEGALLTGGDVPANETITTDGPLANSNVGTPNDGVITTLAAGATATFSVTLTVTQAEVDDG